MSEANLDNAMWQFMPKEEDGHYETIKWTHTHNQINSRYEINIPILDSLEPQDVLTHCLNVISKVETATAAEDAIRAYAFFNVFPRTLSTVIQPTWQQVIDDAADDDNVQHDQEHREHFDSCLMEFIACHMTADDTYEFKQLLQEASQYACAEFLLSHSRV